MKRPDLLSGLSFFTEVSLAALLIRVTVMTVLHRRPLVEARVHNRARVLPVGKQHPFGEAVLLPTGLALSQPGAATAFLTGRRPVEPLALVGLWYRTRREFNARQTQPSVAVVRFCA